MSNDEPKKIDVVVNGIPFKVGGVSTEEEAIAEIRKAAQSDPLLMQNKALSLGYDFDFKTQQGRERGEISKFLIGAGKSVDDMADAVHEAFLEQTGASFAELQRFDQQMQEEDAQFAALANNSLAAQGGELAGDVITLGALPGAAALWSVFRLGKALLSTGKFAGKHGKRVLKKMLKEDVSPETIQAAQRTPKGDAILKTLNKMDNPKDDVLSAIARAVKSEAKSPSKPSDFKIPKNPKQQDGFMRRLLDDEVVNEVRRPPPVRIPE